MNIRLYAFSYNKDYPPYSDVFGMAIYLSRSYRQKGGPPRAKYCGVFGKFPVDVAVNIPTVDDLIHSFKGDLSDRDKQQLRQKYASMRHVLIKAAAEQATWSELRARPRTKFPDLWREWRLGREAVVPSLEEMLSDTAEKI